MEMNSRNSAQFASPHPASGHVDSLAALLVRPAAFADSKFLSPLPKRFKSPHPMRRRILTVFIRVNPWLIFFVRFQLQKRESEIDQSLVTSAAT